MAFSSVDLNFEVGPHPVLNAVTARSVSRQMAEQQERVMKAEICIFRRLTCWPRVKQGCTKFLFANAVPKTIVRNMKPVGMLRQFRVGFTLIELLVVIAIIAILASMLLPALAKAKKSSDGMKCQNNQRQIALSMRFYSEDVGRWVPYVPSVAAMTPQPNPAMPGAIWKQDWNGSGTVAFFQTWMDLIYPYLNNSTIFACPAVGGPNREPGFQGHLIQNYGYNGYLGGRIVGGGRGYRDITTQGGSNPERVIVTADYNLQWAYWMYEGDWAAQAQNVAAQNAWGSFGGIGYGVWKQLAVYRHKDRTQVSFADGHVEFVEKSDPSYYGAAGRDAHFDPARVP